MANTAQLRTSIYFFRLIRELSIAGIIIISIVPETSNKYFFLLLSSVWILSALIVNPKSFLRSFIYPRLESYSIYLWLITYILYNLSIQSSDDAGQYLLNYTRIGFSILLYNYYIEANDDRPIKKISYISVIALIFTSLTTLYALGTNPDAARVLSTGRDELIQDITGMMIGSYGFIYSLVFVVIAIYAELRYGLIKKYKMFYVFLLFFFLIVIFKASFTMALLIVVLFFSWITFDLNKYLKIALLILFAFSLVLLPNLLYHFLNFVGDTIQNESMSLRFHELALLFKGDFENTIDLSARFEFYTLSLKTFLLNPFLGVGGYYGYDTKYYGIGGHSAFLDELARYGLLGTFFLFVSLIVNIKYEYKWFKNREQKRVYFYTVLSFLFLGLVNTLFFVPIIITLYIIVPSLILSISDTKKIHYYT